jgi:CRP/FNR family transcriptional regulator
MPEASLFLQIWRSFALASPWWRHAMHDSQLTARTDLTPSTPVPSEASRIDDAASWATRFPSPHTVPAETELFQQHSVVSDVFWLDDGLIKLVHDDRDGRRRILALKPAHSLVGLPFALSGVRSPVTAVTATRAAIRRLPGRQFALLLTTDLRLSWRLHQMHSTEICGYFERLADLAGSSSRHRLERFLRALVSDQPSTGSSARIHLPLKRGELAQFLAVTPEHLSRLFKQLSAEGVIRPFGGALIVPDVNRLQTFD